MNWDVDNKTVMTLLKPSDGVSTASKNLIDFYNKYSWKVTWIIPDPVWDGHASE